MIDNSVKFIFEEINTSKSLYSVKYEGAKVVEDEVVKTNVFFLRGAEVSFFFCEGTNCILRRAEVPLARCQIVFFYERPKCIIASDRSVCLRSMRPMCLFGRDRCIFGECRSVFFKKPMGLLRNSFYK